MQKRLMLAVLALAFIAGGSWILNRPAPETGLLPGAASAQEAEDGDAAEIDTSTIPDMVQGSDDAPVELIEYASFTCPHCREFTETLYPTLKEDYIDTGKVRLVYREVYFDRYGLWASMVARCGGEMRFFGISEMLYERQRDWAAGEPAEIAENLRRLGKTAGLSEDQLETCLTDGTTAQTLIAWYQENAEADDINSTPSFVINGEKFDGNWSSGLMPAIDAALE